MNNFSSCSDAACENCTHNRQFFIKTVIGRNLFELDATDIGNIAYIYQNISDLEIKSEANKKLRKLFKQFEQYS